MTNVMDIETGEITGTADKDYSSSGSPSSA